MFYSHEILASPQHGVATVWLVASLGHTTSSRKLTRKAIESVNVPRACNTIEKPPGAPLALRLQGNLLYGISGVYHKHGGYLLHDVEKVWTRMQAYFRDVQRSAANMVDPNAGKARRGQLILVDDPSFVPDLVLPSLDFDENGDLVLPGLDFSQRSKLSSQLSPIDHSSGSSANAPFINLDIRDSSGHAGLGFPTTLGKGNQKLGDDDMFAMGFGEEEELPFADFPIRIDAEGNLIEEPELPPHPSQQQEELVDPAQKDRSGAHFPQDEAPIIPGDDDAMVVFEDDEGLVPILDGAPQNAQQNNDLRLPSEELLSSDPAQQPQPQRKHRKVKARAPDIATHISRAEFKRWTDNYAVRMKDGHNAPHQVTISEARNNAYHLVFGRGLGGVGELSALAGANHELAELFAGENLKDIAMGNSLDGVNEEVDEEGRGARRRRSASVAFGSDEEEEGEEGRRVRPRVDDGEQEQEGDHPQLGGSQQAAQVVGNPLVMFGDELPEMGREHPGSALSDHRRSSNAPWNRPESVVPSSARSGKHVEAGRGAVENSPLVGRGSLLQGSDVKFSDSAMPVFGSDGFAPLQHGGAHDLSSFGDFVAAAAVSAPEANTSQVMREALDREGQNFLGFVERVAADRGEEDIRDESLRWVKFDGLFDAQDKNRSVVAQAFLHVLTLATKNKIRVRQAGVEDKEPFGEIRVGVTGPVLEVDEAGASEFERMEGVEGEGEEVED